jgi:hypothetical protein
LSVTVTSPISAGYVPNGATTAFAFNFKIASAAEIAVYQVLNGVATLISPSAYSVVVAGGEGGTVTFHVAPLAGTGTIYVVSAPLLTQTLALANGGPFTPSILNGALDRAAIRAVFLNFQANRSLKVPINETAPGYPAVAARADHYLTHDDAGVPVPGVSTAAVNGMLSDISTNALAIANEATTRANADAVLTAGFAVLSGALSTGALASIGVPSDSIGGVFPEQFGALGNGVANDTAAFQALSAFVNAAGGGRINFRSGAVYLVGAQTLANEGPGGWMWKGQDILSLDGCSRPVIIEGNGAKIKLANGFKFGTLDAAGNPTTHALPYFDSAGDLSSPLVDGIVSIQNCTAKVAARDFEIDGNEANQVWGGPYGDTGWQVPGDNLFLRNNSGGEEIDIYSHHALRDCVQLIGPAVTASSPKTGGVFRLRCEYGVRQGLSLTQGRGYTFIGSKFNHTGQGSHQSSPGAGVDLEAEGGMIRDVEFIDCEFSGNGGVACLADSGDTQRVHFQGCNFIGQHNWAGWFVKPFFTFDDCVIAGSLKLDAARVLGDVPSPKSALPRWTRCTFSDDYALSDTGSLTAAGAILESSSSNLDQMTFDQCHFRAGHNIGIGGVGGIYRNCTFDMGPLFGFIISPSLIGVTTITADPANDMNSALAALGGGVFQGQILINGVDQRRGTVVNDLASIANGATATFGLSLLWARIGRDVFDVTFDSSLLGLKASAYCDVGAVYFVSAGHVVVQVKNDTGAAVDLPSGTWTVVARDKDLA